MYCVGTYNHHHYYATHSMLMVRVMVAVFRVRDYMMMQRGYKRRDVNRNSNSGGR